jgi:sterol desaturase/sphingolipid hydroxylase (fatty acid hydroxylase superfamily)
LLHFLTLGASFVAKRFAGLLLPLDSPFSAFSLLSALCVAVAFLLARRRPDRRAVKYGVMWRALFPSWLYRNASFRADVGFLLLNVLAFTALFGWAMLSSSIVGHAVAARLTAVIGVSAGIGLSNGAGSIVAVVALFLAYELGYWLDHYLSHRIPVLWEFHKVHHTAEVLSPLTNFRVHPVDSLVFSNILGLFTGVTAGVLDYLKCGTPFAPGENFIFLAFVWSLGHLQHSHVWISITGPLGRVILSPAHHQIHHSDNPKHFDRNFGSCLSVWDWMFGTLHMPEHDRERLSFGVGHRTAHDHTVTGGLFTPFAMAWRRLRPSPKKPRGRLPLNARPASGQ